MSQLTTSMVNWLEDMSVEKLTNVELIFKRVRAIKGLISQKEKEIKSLDEQFLASLYAVMGKSRQDAKEEKRQEITELHNLLRVLQNNRKVHQHLRNITKFDIPSLRSVGRTIDTMVERKLTFEDPFLRNFTMTPAQREEYDRKKNEERQRRMNEERQRMEENKQNRLETAQRIKKEKQESFDKLKSDLLRQTAREPYKISPVFDFVEPAPGCHYDIGQTFGHVIIPIPPDYQQITEEVEIEAYEGHGNEFIDEIREEGRREVLPKYAQMDGFLRLVHEYAYMITEQLFDNLGGKIDIQIFTVENWIYYSEMSEEIVISIDRIHNTSFYSIISCNMIFQICDKISEVLLEQYKIDF